MHPTNSQHSQPLSFENSRGFKLDARLELPRQPRYFAIMCHCFTCTKDTITTHRISRGLAQQGIGVLRFDFTGLGKSQGNFADTNFDTMLDDLFQAVKYLHSQGHGVQVLMGHSMGGTVALAAAAELEQIKAAVTIAAPSEPRHVLHHFSGILDKLSRGESAAIHVAGRAYPVKPQFVDNVRSFSMAQQLQHFNKPLLAIRAGHDEMVSASNADEIIAMGGKHPLSRLLDIENAGHLFTDKQDSQTMITEISHWLDQVMAS